jgi:hypothetical protein
MQIGKKNIYRISIEELAFSIGFGDNDYEILQQLIAFFIVRGDIIIDTTIYNKLSHRKSIIDIARKLGAAICAYVVTRPIDQCSSDDYTKEEIEESHDIDMPKLLEGFSKVITVSWIQSIDLISVDNTIINAKPIITVIEHIPDNMPISVKQKKKIIKHNLERGRQNLFRPKP